MIEGVLLAFSVSSAGLVLLAYLDAAMVRDEMLNLIRSELGMDFDEAVKELWL